METILTGSVWWSYDHEVARRTKWESVISFLGPYPFHKHEGDIALTETRIFIDGDEAWSIPLSTIDKLYLGFDEIFPMQLVKNFLSWRQPLRITLRDGRNVYLFIDYIMIGRTNNLLWFNTLKEMLSE